jgi:hypothetical protein
MFVLQETDRIEDADLPWKGYEGSDADLVRGLTLVAAALRRQLLEHALDCDCGSDAWLAQMTFQMNGGEQ